MAKDKITDFSPTPSLNTDIGNISLLGNASPRVIKDYMPELMSQLADMNAGTAPLDDTFTIRDPDDNTKKARLDAGNVPTATSRELDAEAIYQLLQRGATPRLVTAYTASGTHTFNTATKYFQIIAVGAGGGSGGVDGQLSSGASTAGANSGFFGRSAFFAKNALTSGTVVIGSGGTAGSSDGATPGGDGGDTTWADSTNGTLTWKGGKGSTGTTATGSYRYVLPLANLASSVSLIGSYSVGGPGLSNGTTNAGGLGGSSPWGTGGIPSALANGSAVDGVVGTGHGAGASGAASNGISTNAPGAAGTGGRLEVWEY